MKQLKSICLLLMLALLPLPLMANEQKEDGEALNIPELVLEHLADAYEWHITTIGDKHIGFDLPIIIRSSQTGEWFFCTAHTLPDGFFFNEEAHGKIYERVDGAAVRPLDLSITRNVLQIWIVVAVLLVVFLCCARWYKKHDKTDKAPGGFVGAMEMLVMMINDDVIKSSIGEKHYKKYAPYLLTVFFFIFFTFLAVCTFLAVNLFGNREYWKDIFWPDVPVFLKAPIPIMPAIELFGVFTKPFALMIRLFANMMAGHAMILAFTCVIFLGWTLGPAMGTGLHLFSAIMLLFMNTLELLVAFVQAYVFTMLSAVFIGLAHKEHGH